ncbi:MAG: hypothetical protein A2113_03760 [Candidatus Woykebacteria bacterium GWA1_44_8]|uniref:Uncharacterized protein n=1 Tax=Candidatus Woykebacteria bacterium GWA1_44_8 TaxID=1802591 RepID=A0A1G1W1U4_9BACT|nr:MAG: hypothetical protein A2113_03760 [Candidatus Woykebacteria bacterium GWA1_44_8]
MQKTEEVRKLQWVLFGAAGVLTFLMALSYYISIGVGNQVSLLSLINNLFLLILLFVSAFGLTFFTKKSLSVSLLASLLIIFIIGSNLVLWVLVTIMAFPFFPPDINILFIVVFILAIRVAVLSKKYRASANPQ